MTISVLKAIKQIVYQFSERTAPSVKFSQRNYLVAQITLAIDDLIKHLQAKKVKQAIDII